MRRVGRIVAIVVAMVGWVAEPQPGLASCADTVTLDQVAREPGSAVFTGRATGVVGANDDVLFVVDRWFHGPQAARVTLLLGWSAVLLEPPAAGVVPVALAKTVSGDAISLVRDEPVLMIATWIEESGGFGASPCTVAGTPLDSPEGRDALRAAEAVFGPGRSAAALPVTDTVALDAGDSPTDWLGLGGWWLVAVAFAMAVVLVLARRRT